MLLVVSLSVGENKQADAGHDGQTHLVRPNSRTTSRIGNNTRLIHTLITVLTIHTYI